MAITYVGTGTTVYSTGNPSPGAVSGQQVGDLLILAVGTKPDTTPATTPSGWTLLGAASGGTGSTGIDTGPMRVGIFYKIATSAGETPGAITITGNNVSTATIYAFRAGAGNVFDIAGTGAADTTTGTPHSAVMPVNPGITVGDMLLAIGVIPTDVTTPAQFSAETVSAAGMTTVSLTEIEEWDTQSGQDMGGWVAYGTVATGTATGAPTVSATAGGTTTNVAGPIYLTRLRELPAQATKAGSDSGTRSVTETASVAQITPKTATTDSVTHSTSENSSLSKFDPPAEIQLAEQGSNTNGSTSVASISSSFAAQEGDVVVVYASYGNTLITANPGVSLTNSSPLNKIFSTDSANAHVGTVSTSGTCVLTVQTDFEYVGYVYYVLRGVKTTSSPVVSSVVPADVHYGTTSFTPSLRFLFGNIYFDNWPYSSDTGTILEGNKITRTVFPSRLFYGTPIRYTTSGTNYTDSTFMDTPSTENMVSIEFESAVAAPSANPIIGSENFTHSTTETALVTGSAFVPVNDSATESAAESSQSVVSSNRSDTGTVSVTDASSSIATLSRSDSGTLSTTDTSSVYVSSSLLLTDNSAHSATEAASVSATLSLADAGTHSTADASSIFINASYGLSDIGATSTTESASVAGTASLGETGTHTTVESAGMFKSIALADSGTLSGADSSSSIVNRVMLDSGTHVSTESAVVSVTGTISKAASDSGTLSTSDSSAIVISSTVSLSDTGTISATEATTNSSSIARTDAGTWSAAETRGIASTGAISDSGTHSTLESANLIATLGASDSGIISAGESIEPLVSVSSADSVENSATESLGAFVYRSISDAGSHSASDATTVGSSISRADAGTVTANESLGVNSILSRVDSGYVYITAEIMDVNLAYSERSFSDVGVNSVSESASIVVSMALSDSGATNADEDSYFFREIAMEDYGQNSVFEGITWSTDIERLDSGTYSVTESASVFINDAKSISDSGTISATEGRSVSGAGTVSDSGVFSTTDTSFVFKSIARSESGTHSVSESSIVFNDRISADLGIHSVSESTSLFISGLVIKGPSGSPPNEGPTTINDSSTITASEVSVVGASIAKGDSATHSTAENRQVDVNGSASDTGQISTSEEALIDCNESVLDNGTHTVNEQVEVQMRETSGFPVQVWTGTEFVEGGLNIWNGSEYETPEMQIWNGADWS